MQINKSGLWGEIYAARYLRNNKFDILTANYRTRLGEIDIICSKDESIRFVEVKTRDEGYLYQPKEAVDKAKQDRIIATAMQYIKATQSSLQPQFDVIEVILDSNFKPTKINYLENAFNT